MQIFTFLLFFIVLHKRDIQMDIFLIFPWKYNDCEFSLEGTSYAYLNPCPAEQIKMPRPFLINQSDYLI